MNIPILIANILTLLAFFIHTFIGDRELKIIEPGSENDEKNSRQEKWTMVRCGWHWISLDLLFATIGLGIINFTDFLLNCSFKYYNLFPWIRNCMVNWDSNF